MAAVCLSDLGCSLYIISRLLTPHILHLAARVHSRTRLCLASRRRSLIPLPEDDRSPTSASAVARRAGETLFRSAPSPFFAVSYPRGSRLLHHLPDNSVDHLTRPLELLLPQHLPEAHATHSSQLGCARSVASAVRPHQRTGAMGDVRGQRAVCYEVQRGRAHIWVHWRLGAHSGTCDRIFRVGHCREHPLYQDIWSRDFCTRGDCIVGLLIGFCASSAPSTPRSLMFSANKC